MFLFLAVSAFLGSWVIGFFEFLLDFVDSDLHLAQDHLVTRGHRFVRYILLVVE